MEDINFEELYKSFINNLSCPVWIAAGILWG